MGFAAMIGTNGSMLSAFPHALTAGATQNALKMALGCDWRLRLLAWDGCYA
jgi:hypothetical protein